MAKSTIKELEATRIGALAAIGSTPLITLTKLGAGRIHAKAEFLSPGGSVKDRGALYAILGARRTGALRPGQPVVEMTSGNTGAGLALVCGVLGHRFHAVMSAGNSPQRAEMIRTLGAVVVLVPQADGSPGKVTGRDLNVAEARARALTVELDGHYIDQFNNPGMVEAHEKGTGPEILRQLGRAPDAFVACVGTGGSFVGVSRALKAADRRVLCFPVEPEGAEVLAGKPLTNPAHLLQGAGYGRIPPLWDRALADGDLAVSDAEAEAYRERLAVQEGLHVGYTSAANVCAAVKLQRSGRLPSDAHIVTLLCDTGFKYPPRTMGGAWGAG